MKVGFQTAGVKGRSLLTGVIEQLRNEEIAFVSSYSVSGTLDSSYEEIRALCASRGVRFIERADLGRAESALADVILVAGWQFMMSEIDERYVVFHDSLLPKLRGFNPTVSALILGHKSIGVSALMPSGSADEGPLYGQERVSIRYPIRIREAYEKLGAAYTRLAIQVIKKFRSKKKVATKKQNSKLATYSLWRNPDDYWIDWTRPAAEIVRHVHAVGWPYLGAKGLLGDTPVTILEASVIPDLRFEPRAAGKLWKIDGGQAHVVCGSGMIRIDDVRGPDGTPFVFTRLRQRFKPTV